MNGSDGIGIVSTELRWLICGQLSVLEHVWTERPRSLDGDLQRLLTEVDNTAIGIVRKPQNVTMRRNTYLG